MEAIEVFFKTIADFLWKDWMLVMLLGLGILYTLVTRFAQIRFFPYVVKQLIQNVKEGRRTKKEEGKFSSYQALCTAIASCVGSGNIVGVATAILAGGPGVLFWMWVAAFVGMATKLAEITLGIRYRSQDKDGNVTGGPMYYIAHAFKLKWVGALAAVLLFIQNAAATLIQSNTIAGVVKEAFSVTPLVTGIILAVIMVSIISGGLKRLIHTAEKIVPIMASVYILGGLIVILVNIESLPAVFASIIEGAFTLETGVGVAAGFTMRQAMRYGVARGLYSNEAGEGSAAVLHSSAQVDHPVRQGLYGILEVFIDTIILCSTTGITILITGVNQVHTHAPTLAAEAFGTVFPAMRFVIYISLILFAGTSIMSQWYFGHVSLTYLNKPKGAVIYRIIFPFLIILGSMSTIEMVWSIQDCALGLLIIPNVIALIILVPEVKSLIKEFTDPKNGYLEKKGMGQDEG